MCGICGIYGEGDKSSVKAMTETLEHRGPDSWGIQFDKHCVLGHRRLAILDLSENGDQPMANEDDTVWLVVNGEIYNYKSLRDILIGKGHVFKSESDSEVIIHAYEEYGLDFVNKLRGMFALALYDSKEQILILARDPIGKKPIYFHYDNHNIVFASEIKALFKAGVPCEVNYDAIPSWLMYQYTMGENTLFKGVRKLLAGHMLVMTPESMNISRYWHLSDRKVQSEGRDNPVEHLRGLLEESVKLRLQSDVPVGSFLSGGIDSSAVTALYRQFSAGPIHTFTATFGEHSEAKYAKQVSDYLNTEYHEVPITPQMVAQDIEKITWHHDEPLGDAATINNFYLSKEAKKYVTVVLAGEGGDEVFGGYPWYKYAGFIEHVQHVPWQVRMTGHMLLWLLNRGDVTARTYGLTRKANFPLQPENTDLFLYPTTSMDVNGITWLLKSAGEDWPEPITSECVSDTYNRMLMYDCLNKLPEQYLMKADKGTMSHAIEERLPLLDKEVIEYAFTLPISLKKDKYILRKAVQDLLPQEIVWRPKKGFGTPLTDWLMDDDLNDMVAEHLFRGPLLSEICKSESRIKLASLVVSKELKPTSMMALSPVNVIWSLFALQTWHDVWFGGER